MAQRELYAGPDAPYDSTDSEPRAVCIANQKGGSTKTTIAINTADRLAARGHDTLFVDLDPNGHASTYLGFEDAYEDNDEHLGDVILDSGDLDPQDIIEDTDFGFDVIPANDEYKRGYLEDRIKGSSFPNTCLKVGLIDPLLGNDYDYIIVDTPSYPGKLTDNALIGTGNLMVPLSPGGQATKGFQRMLNNQLKEIMAQMDLSILAVVPNVINGRIDHENQGTKLVRDANDGFPEKTPNFARLTEEDWARIDAGEYQPRPGIRSRDAINDAHEAQQPLGHYDPENDQLGCFDELAAIVETGGVQHG